MDLSIEMQIFVYISYDVEHYNFNVKIIEIFKKNTFNFLKIRYLFLNFQKLHKRCFFLSAFQVKKM